MKKFKKMLAVLLSAIMLATVFTPAAFAVDYKQEVPHIDFRGFMSYTIYEDKDDPDSERVFPPSTTSIISSVTSLAPSLTKLAITNNWKAFGDTFILILKGLLSPVGFNSDGTAKNKSGIHFTYPTKEELIENNLEVDFQYDWRDDPYKSAAELDKLITYLTDELGYSGVTLESHSYAGIVMLTYLSTYGTEKIKSCCFNATAVYGAQFAGELVNGKVTVSNEALVSFLKGLFDHNEYAQIIAAVTDVLYAAGVTGFVADFVTNLFDNLSDRIWTEAILPALGNWPSIWAMVPDAYLESGYDNVFNNLYKDSQLDFTGLKNKIEKYNTDIRINRENKLKAIDLSDTNLYVIARYGYSGVPIGDIWTASTDTVLNTAAESFGATCKDYDFEEESKTAERYISPNGSIDASTCLFPDKTWFIRDCTHTQRDETIIEFAKALLYSDEQVTIDTYEEYPQYLFFDDETSDIVIDEQQTSKENAFIRFFKKLFELFFFFIRKVLRKY